ncbi:hypothetical protein CRENBAI_008961 [Crenichthys baileyi]|uniref:Uncharacterized protein n=1 Tax=Crenichthys baileyi TaxID=28760 RepID=A0AAV9RUK4_9TELE
MPSLGRDLLQTLCAPLEILWGQCKVKDGLQHGKACGDVGQCLLPFLNAISRADSKEAANTLLSPRSTLMTLRDATVRDLKGEKSQGSASLYKRRSTASSKGHQCAFSRERSVWQLLGISPEKLQQKIAGDTDQTSPHALAVLETSSDLTSAPQRFQWCTHVCRRFYPSSAQRKVPNRACTHRKASPTQPRPAAAVGGPGLQAIAQWFKSNSPRLTLLRLLMAMCSISMGQNQGNALVGLIFYSSNNLPQHHLPRSMGEDGRGADVHPLWRSDILVTPEGK